MCDEATEADSEAYTERLRLSRREVGAGAGATLAAMLTGCTPSATPPSSSAAAPPEPAPPAAPAKPAEALRLTTTQRMVSIDTPDGVAEAFFVTPQAGQHPGVVMWPDVAGLRDAYRTMATRLASAGYAVLAVNQYYRSSKLPILATFSEWRTDEGKAKLAPMRGALTAEGIAKDGAAFTAWLDRQAVVAQARKLASCGYCMGGPFAFRTAAAAAAGRVGAVASFHGGGLVTEDAASPHQLLVGLRVAALICIAQNDDEKEPDAKVKLRESAERAQVPAEIEVYPAQHGWCTIDSPVYDQEQAERAWARMLHTFQQNL